MNKTHILVIDDEKALCKSIGRILSKEYQVSLAYSGVQGLKIARRVRPDLIILDVIMPGLDGYDTCRELKNDPLLASVPILFLSALAGTDSKVTSLEAGADDYVVKPFDIREFKLRIKALLRRSMPRSGQAKTSLQNGATSTATTLKFGTISLDSQSFTVTTPTGSCSLTPMEFDLLYCFMSHPGEVFSSIRLLQNVWDYPTDTGSPDLVRMHIKNLRSKIEPDPKRPIYIKTIRRRGYTMPNPVQPVQE